MKVIDRINFPDLLPRPRTTKTKPDPWRLIAAKYFKVEYEDVTVMQRLAAKAAVHAYSAGASEKTAKGLIEEGRDA